MKYAPINPQLFINNRKLFAGSMVKGSMAIFHSNDEMPSNGDQHYSFSQQSDLFWLSGIDQEQSVLILFPDCPDPKYKEVLFLRQTSELIAVWEGHKYTKSEAMETSGVRTVFWLDEYDNIMNSLMNWANSCYINLNENDRFSTEVEYRNLRKANELNAKYPAYTFHRAAPLFKKLRSVKSSIEVDLIREAVNITESAFKRVLQFIKPGVWEYEIEAEIIHEFLRNKATGHAYHPIVASGKNACVLHYVDNNQECKSGDLLLMDFGAEYAHYAADLTRTIPVNGKFTDRQKAVYNAVLKVMQEAKQMLVPGTLVDEYHKEVGKVMEAELVQLGLLGAKDVRIQDPEKPLYKKYFMHGTSHHLGLDVHDLADRHQPMQAGNVFTCEPGIYIAEEGIGIRIENDILVTEDGPLDLMESIPVEVDEIEALMSSKASIDVV